MLICTSGCIPLHVPVAVDITDKENSHGAANAAAEPLAPRPSNSHNPDNHLSCHKEGHSSQTASGMHGVEVQVSGTAPVSEVVQHVKQSAKLHLLHNAPADSQQNAVAESHRQRPKPFAPQDNQNLHMAGAEPAKCAQRGQRGAATGSEATGAATATSSACLSWDGNNLPHPEHFPASLLQYNLAWAASVGCSAALHVHHIPSCCLANFCVTGYMLRHVVHHYIMLHTAAPYFQWHGGNCIHLQPAALQVAAMPPPDGPEAVHLDVELSCIKATLEELRLHMYCKGHDIPDIQQQPGLFTSLTGAASQKASVLASIAPDVGQKLACFTEDVQDAGLADKEEGSPVSSERQQLQLSRLILPSEVAAHSMLQGTDRSLGDIDAELQARGYRSTLHQDHCLVLLWSLMLLIFCISFLACNLQWAQAGHVSTSGYTWCCCSFCAVWYGHSSL